VGSAGAAPRDPARDRAARANGRKVALALSAIFLMEVYRDDFMKLLDDGLVDILFCNEGEAMALMQGMDLEAATRAIAERVPLLVVTHGDKGAVAVSEGKNYTVPAERVEKVVDTTGAGDLFAAGFPRRPGAGALRSRTRFAWAQSPPRK
jgi:sugar/nucleoside kinase (ribokinase family)